MKRSRLISGGLAIGVALTLAMASSSAQAQWVWKDDAGQVVASDQPPPGNVPPSRILKQPKARAVAAAPAVDKTAGTDPARADAPKSLADRELESKQHAKEAAEAAKKADDEAAKAQALQANCTAVRGNMAALETGGRAARFNEKGERYYIDDSQRQAEIARSQGQIAQYCK